MPDDAQTRAQQDAPCINRVPDESSIWALANRASAEVAAWPAWKRRAADEALVSAPEPPTEYTTKPIIYPGADYVTRGELVRALLNVWSDWRERGRRPSKDGPMYDLAEELGGLAASEAEETTCDEMPFGCGTCEQCKAVDDEPPPVPAACADCTGDADTCPVEECEQCSVRDCPHGEPLHHHHDGCPACMQEDEDIEREDELDHQRAQDLADAAADAMFDADIRPRCIQCGGKWWPREGVDAQVMACEMCERPTMATAAEAAEARMLRDRCKQLENEVEMLREAIGKIVGSPRKDGAA